MSKEVIVKLTSDRIKVKGGEYVQDVIRCEKCALNETDDCPMVYYTPLEDGGFETNWWNKPNDFCSWGEVRDE